MVDRSPAVRGVAAAFLTLSSIAVILRCYVRLRIVKAFGWDDGIMILAMLFYIMFCACMIGGGIWGTGRHLTELTPKQRTVAMEYWFLCDVAYAISSILAKISVCIFLLRVMLFPWHRITLYTVTALAVVTGIVFFVLLVIQCSPVSFFWTRMSGDTSGQCRYIDAIAIMLYIFSVTSALFDLTVGLLPIILVYKLQMNTQTKVAVAGLLGMACVASIAIIIRIPFVQTIRDPDFLYATVEIAIWSAIEIGLSITAGSLATTRPLFRIFRSYPSSSYRPFDDNDYNGTWPSNQNSKKRQSKPSLKPSSKSRSTNPSGITLHALATFDDPGVGRNNSVSTRTATCTHNRNEPRSPTGLENDVASEFRDGGRDGLSKTSAEFYGPYLGMMTMRAMAEGGRGDESGSSTSYSAAGQEGVLNVDGRRGEGLPGQPMPMPTLADARSRSESMSRIGVHRTFEVSSETKQGAERGEH
ncbi:hypothetical protein BJX63DRAFT_384567 [Aspergillus granulosus]|uniref:Rhodopsin domain-containing protein n=1 Tax=Aspergillus granulosus TaxID=176169 RepID=A0ABR4HRH1_9EURO